MPEGALYWYGYEVETYVNAPYATRTINTNSFSFQQSNVSGHNYVIFRKVFNTNYSTLRALGTSIIFGNSNYDSAAFELIPGTTDLTSMEAINNSAIGVWSEQRHNQTIQPVNITQSLTTTTTNRMLCLRTYHYVTWNGIKAIWLE